MEKQENRTPESSAAKGPLFSFWRWRFGLTARVGHLLVSVGLYPGNDAWKYPSDWRPVVVEWKDKSWPR